MMVKITKINDRELLVNGKTVFKDSSGNWLQQHALNTVENQAALEYIAALESKIQEKPL